MLMLVGWSVGWLVRPSITLLFFGLLGVTNAVYTAPLLVFLIFLPSLVALFRTSYSF